MSLGLLLRLQLRAGNNSTNISNSSDEEGDCLEPKVNEIVVLSINKVIASTQEKKCCKSQLQCVESVKMSKENKIPVKRVKTCATFYQTRTVSMKIGAFYSSSTED